MLKSLENWHDVSSHDQLLRGLASAPRLASCGVWTVFCPGVTSASTGQPRLALTNQRPHASASGVAGEPVSLTTGQRRRGMTGRCRCRCRRGLGRPWRSSSEQLTADSRNRTTVANWTASSHPDRVTHARRRPVSSKHMQNYRRCSSTVQSG